jgi:hypothetical protein
METIGLLKPGALIRFRNDVAASAGVSIPQNLLMIVSVTPRRAQEEHYDLNVCCLRIADGMIQNFLSSSEVQNHFLRLIHFVDRDLEKERKRVFYRQIRKEGFENVI